jgi:mono/diheme cytochrome c family protein
LHSRQIHFRLPLAIACFIALAIIALILLIPGSPTPVRAEAINPPMMQQASVVFTHDVAPILYANCVSCHHTGEAGPFPLVTYEDARKHAGLIAQVTRSKQMPPWKAESDYGHFKNERHLSDQDVATLAQWAQEKAPEGDPAQLPPTPEFASEGEWQLGKPDLVVQMAQPYTVPASGRDVFRCFILPLNLKHDEFVTAVEFRPSDRRVVHHALLFLDDRGRAQNAQKTWTTQHPEDKQIGYNHFGGPGFTPTGGLGGWAPGATPSFLPDGVARYLAAGSDLVIQTHFHPTGKVEVEQSTVAIYFAKSPPKHIISPMLLGNRHIDIPAGQTDYVVTDTLAVPANLSVIGITPHAHLICKQMDVWATLPAPTTAPSGGKTEEQKIPLIRINDWDFNWQGQYRYAEPLHLPKGATLHMRYTYDNSADNDRNPNTPPQPIHFGEQTTDEMAFCFLEVIPDNPADALAIRRARFLHALSLR